MEVLPAPPIAIQSPVATTVSWFRAVNDHNMPLAQEHFVSANRDMMNWSSWGPRLRISTATLNGVPLTAPPSTAHSRQSLTLTLG